MGEKREFKGYYCRQCHVYTRLYSDERRGGFSGVCPRCGTKLHLDEASEDDGLFFTGGSDYRTINIWDSYLQRNKIGEVDKGTPAKVLETQVYNGVTWYRIRAEGIEGWVSGTFIRQLS